MYYFLRAMVLIITITIYLIPPRYIFTRYYLITFAGTRRCWIKAKYVRLARSDQVTKLLVRYALSLGQRWLLILIKQPVICDASGKFAVYYSDNGSAVIFHGTQKLGCKH